MKKARHGIICTTLLFVLLAFPGIPHAFECVAPDGQNCLQCHVYSDIHSFHFTELGLYDPYPADCLLCHCGDAGTSACEDVLGFGPVEAVCCTTCHSQCYEVDKHVSRAADCTSCHIQTNIGLDDDCDGICNPGVVDVSCTGSDNCSSNPNGPALGTCTEGVLGRTCTSSDQCGTGGFCSINQEDSYPPGGNGCGDACELNPCYADCSDDHKVDLADLVIMKGEFGRSNCATIPCMADCNYDDKVDLADLVIMKGEFGRSDCPACP